MTPVFCTDLYFISILDQTGWSAPSSCRYFCLPGCHGLLCELGQVWHFLGMQGVGGCGWAAERAGGQQGSKVQRNADFASESDSY